MPDLKTLDRILNPRSIVVVGASADENKLGGRCLKWLREFGYGGKVFCVNPGRSSIHEYPCFPTLDAVPHPIDMVMLAVPREETLPLLHSAGAKGAAGCINFASGYGESGADGAASEAELTAAARRAGVKLIGPNCFGIANFHARTMMTPAAALGMPDYRVGGLSIIAQSGGIGLGTALAMVNRSKIGIGMIISVGNEADLETADFLEYLIEDARTDAIALVIEGFKTPLRYGPLFDRARALCKPVVILSLGTSPKGQRMAQLHTGHLAGSHRVKAAFLRQHGVFVADDVDELIQNAAQYGFWASRTRPSPKSRVAIVSISGGQATLAADLGHVHRLELAELSGATVAAAKGLLPPYANVVNPLDIGAYAMGNPKLVGQLVVRLQADPQVDVIVVVLITARTYEVEIRDLIAISDASSKPVLICWPGGEVEGDSPQLLIEAGIPCYGTLGAAMKAVARYCDLRQIAAADPGHEAAETGGIPALPDGEETFLDEWDGKQLLKAAGIAVPRARKVDSVQAAAQAADAIGYPVVVKGISRDVIHKARHGLVALRLASAEEVRGACERIERSFAKLAEGADVPRWGGFLVEEHVDSRHEYIVGLMRDPDFGMTLLLGAGGAMAEQQDDVALRVLPARRADIVQMLQGLRAWRALDRATQERLQPAFVAAVARIAAAGVAWSTELEALDINPLLLDGERAIAVDVVVQCKTVKQEEFQ